MEEKYIIIYENEALEALEEIAYYYAIKESYGLSESIVTRIRTNIASIASMPNRFPISIFSNKIRKVSIINLPYIAYFTVLEQTIHIVEILHGARNQDFLYEKYKNF